MHNTLYMFFCFFLAAYKLCPDSLHHLVWLELHRENAKISSYDFISEVYFLLNFFTFP